ncbi:hypothetical protein, partial [Pseudomonas bubulae]|uniref:hypothetical protein n=1 Tax=Pseudomonas bubulae TaxID=2316085 RepID=UPI00309AE36A
KKANIQELQISCYIGGAERYIFVTENDRPCPLELKEKSHMRFSLMNMSPGYKTPYRLASLLGSI